MFWWCGLKNWVHENLNKNDLWWNNNNFAIMLFYHFFSRPEHVYHYIIIWTTLYFFNFGHFLPHFSHSIYTCIDLYASIYGISTIFLISIYPCSQPAPFKSKPMIRSHWHWIRRVSMQSRLLLSLAKSWTTCAVDHASATWSLAVPNVPIQVLMLVFRQYVDWQVAKGWQSADVTIPDKKVYVTFALL